MSQLLCANSSAKEAHRAEHKVQFAEIQELDAKTPRRVARADYRQRGNSSTDMQAASSLSSLSSNNIGSYNKPVSNSGSCSLERLPNKTSFGSPKHSSSFNKNKSAEYLNTNLDAKRCQSLERRRFVTKSAATDRSKSRNCDMRDSSKKELKVKVTKYEKNISAEPTKGMPSNRTSHLILTQSGYNKQTDPQFKIHSGLHQMPSDSPVEETCRHKRILPVSPKKKCTHNYDKENEKDRERDKRNASNTAHENHIKAKSLPRELKGRKLPPSGRNNKLEYAYKYEKGAMWSCNSNSGKRTGYLLFNCSNINKSQTDSLAAKYEMSFKFSQTDFKLIRILLESHGFKEVNSNNFSLYWSNVHFNPNEIKQLQEWQKVNHFPRSSELTRKDRLYMNIKRMQRQFGLKLFDFMPTSFVLPTEHRDFCDTHLRERGTWIIKPVASSQGKGIYLVSQVDQVPADETALVCRYLDSPLLVNGYKCDLRLYVLVTSLDPLVVYLYEEGLVRLATVKYQHGKNLWNPCIHLTNYSVNKFHSNYIQNEDPDIDDRGNKWSLSAFLRHLKARGIDTGALMRSIEDVILKSLLSAAYQMTTATNMFVPHSRNCFEMYGFDILIDNQLKPWVLEVNLSPSLNIDQPLDLKIKSSMLSDLFSLIGISISNPNTTKPSRPSVYRRLPNLRYSTESFDRKQFGVNNRNSSSYVPGPEETRIFRQVSEEYDRRGGWARIFPTPDSWAMYGSLQEYDSPLNLILHHHLYPNIPRSNRFYRITPLRMSSVSSSGLASSLERLSCYERALPKTLSMLKDKLEWCGISKRESRHTKDPMKLKASLMDALESGFAFSKYQARMAFSVYLQHIQRRLMIGCDQEKQTDLVYRFLRSATRTLQLPVSVQAPSKTLPKEARAVVISKQLGDFIQAYTKETHLYLDQNASASCSSLSSQCPTTSVPTPSKMNSRSTISSNIQSSGGSTCSLNSKDNESKQQFRCLSNDKVNDPDSFSSGLSESSAVHAVEPSIKCVFREPCAAGSSSFHGSYSSVSSSSSSIAPSCSSSSISKPHSSASILSGSSSDDILEKKPTEVPPKKESRLSFLLSRIKRMNSDGDSGICSADEELHSSQAQKEDVANCQEKSIRQQSRRSSNHEDGIAMELYRAFLSSARESDLEEVLSLQTKKHNSAGVFFDSSRRSRTHHYLNSPSSSGPTAGGTFGGSGSTSRTPTCSPQGSPRRVRKPSSHLGHSAPKDTVTSEPLSRDQTKNVSKENGCPTLETSIAVPPNSSTCCLFGNLLKASLQGTNTYAP